MMETTKEERDEAWAAMQTSIAGRESFAARLIRDVDRLEEALRAMLEEHDPTWEGWTETDDRLLGETGTGKARAALA